MSEAFALFEPPCATSSPSRACRRVRNTVCAAILGMAMAVPGPGAQAWAQSAPNRPAIDKRDAINPPARGNGYLVGGVSLVTLVGVPSITLSVVFSGLRRAAHELGEEVKVPDNDKLLPDEVPNNEEIQEIRRDVDQRLARITTYFVVSSVVGIVGGATMLFLGARRRIRYRRWRRVQRRALGDHQFTPVFSHTGRATATYGIAARF